MVAIAVIATLIIVISAVGTVMSVVASDVAEALT